MALVLRQLTLEKPVWGQEVKDMATARLWLQDAHMTTQEDAQDMLASK